MANRAAAICTGTVKCVLPKLVLKFLGSGAARLHVQGDLLVQVVRVEMTRSVEVGVQPGEIPNGCGF